VQRQPRVLLSGACSRSHAVRQRRVRRATPDVPSAPRGAVTPVASPRRWQAFTGCCHRALGRASRGRHEPLARIACGLMGVNASARRPRAGSGASSVRESCILPTVIPPDGPARARRPIRRTVAREWSSLRGPVCDSAPGTGPGSSGQPERSGERQGGVYWSVTRISTQARHSPPGGRTVRWAASCKPRAYRLWASVEQDWFSTQKNGWPSGV